MAKNSASPAPANRATEAIVTGGGAGAGLAVFAQGLNEPYKTWISISAPAGSAVIVGFWPILRNWVTAWMSTYLTERSKRRAVKMMNEFVATQQSRLKNEKLDSQARQLIEQRIAEVQRARADLEHSIVAIYTQAAE